MSSTAGITRRTVLTALGISALACAADPHFALANEPQGASAAQLASENAITAPEIAGSLPLFCEDPREIDLEDTLVVATPYYAVSLPKALVGTAFSWTWSTNRIEVPADFDGDGASDFAYAAYGFLTVDPGEGSAPFVVYAQDYGPKGMPLEDQSAILGPNFTIHEVGYNGHRIFVGTAPGEDRWVKFVSGGAYAFTREEDEGTRIYTPHYSVLVRPGWIEDGWCFTYNDALLTLESGGHYGKRLDIYASAADRAANAPAMSYVCHDDAAGSFLFRNDPAAWSYKHRTGFAANLELDGTTYSLQTLSWETQAGTPDWTDALGAAELWAACASTEVTQQTLHPATIATTSELWHVKTPWYTFDIPEYWRGRVQVTFKNAGVAVVSPNNNPGAWLVSIWLSPAAGEHPAGDIGSAALFQLENGRGEFVTLNGFNLPFILQGGGWREGHVYGLDPATPEVEQEVIDLATGGALTAEEVLAGADDAVGAAFTYYQEAVIPTIEVAMDDDWAKLASFWLSLDENYLFEPVSEFYARAVKTLGDDPGWLNDLATSDDVQEWARYYCPVSSFLVTTLVRVVNYPEAATSDLTVTDFADQFAPQPR